MTLPDVVTQEEWLTARKELLQKEKAHTKLTDSLNADRRRLPMVRIDKEYVFEGESGRSTLADLFGDSRQLVVYHAMYDPNWENACPGCTASMDELAPALFAHLKSRDTAYVMISRAPYPKIEAYKAKHGWTFPWYSSYGSDFNYDFHTTVDPSIAPPLVNYRTKEELAQAHPDWTVDESEELPAFSAFLRDGGAIFHTYSAFGRGTEVGGDAYSLLDLTALGRQEEWEEPKGRGTRPATPFFD
jgi:predicted dithiol-disulfide oxidoreductase (DUF899 family)